MELMKHRYPVIESLPARVKICAPALALALLLLSACATRSYQYDSDPAASVMQRAVVQTEGKLTLSASVPDENEAAALFGVPLYKRGIQPVWIQVVNDSEDYIRLALSSIDREYFAPLEVAYMYKKGFSKKSRAEMEKRFYQSAVSRRIPPGETRQGYVFTHARPGTKAFNVDLYGNLTDYNFSFFLTVPGFVPDHQEVNFKSLYAADDLENYDMTGFRTALSEKPWTTQSESGETGLPLSVVIVGEGIDVLKALLRAGWYEQPSTRDIVDTATAHYMYGRLPDASFRITRGGKSERNELYLWQTPMRVDGKVVWMGRIAHFIGQKGQIRQVLFGARIDPDLDEGRNYFLQNAWYSQCLEQMAWLKVGPPESIHAPATDFAGTEYFTDGFIAVTWLSGPPVSLIETVNVGWDPAPHR